MARLTAIDRKTSTDTLQTGADDSRLVQAVARGLAVLRAFKPGENSLSNSELAERTGLSKPTISRLSQTLAALGYLSIVPRTGHYQLGAGIVALCHSLLAGMPHRIAARPVLQEIADFSRLPASVGMRDQLVMLTIETAHHPQMRPARFDLGSRLPIETSSMGRAYLFALSEDEREAMLHRIRLQWPRGEWRGVRARIDTAFEVDRQAWFLCVARRSPARRLRGRRSGRDRGRRGPCFQLRRNAFGGYRRATRERDRSASCARRPTNLNGGSKRCVISRSRADRSRLASTE